ncbi:MAG: DUF748 domain-containing protein [Burkholderiales bacterium]
MNKVWIRRVAWAIAALLALGLVSWLAVPPLLKWQAQLRLSEALGRSVTIGKVDFKPWALELAVDDVAIAGAAPAAEPLLKVARLRADLSLSSLLRRAPVIEALEIDAPQLRLARTAPGHFDIDDLIARFAPKADAAPSERALFALYNLQVRNASLRFDDQPAARVHTVEALHLGLPFLSNLPAQVDVKVEPRLAFKLDGAAFDSGALATPFAQTRAGDLKLAVTELDLAHYLPYLPESLPVRLTRGVVSADLALQFSMPAGGTPSAGLRGVLSARDVAVTDAAGAPLLAWQQLKLGLRDVQPLARRLGFERLQVKGLQLHASRDAAGRINLLALAGDKPASAPAAAAASAVASRAASGAASRAASAVPAATPPAWQASLDTLELDDAQVLWNDAAVKPAAALQLDAVNLRVNKLQWPVQNPTALSLAGTLRPQGNAKAPAWGKLSAEGPVTDREARLNLKLDGLVLEAFAPYLSASLVPRVEGRLSAQATLDWDGKAEAPHLKIALDHATLDGLRLRETAERNARAAPDALSLKQLSLNNVQLDLIGRSVVLGSVKLLQPKLAVERDGEGRLNLQRWLVAAAAPAPTAAAASAPAPAAGPVWNVQLKDLLLDGGQLRVSDALARGRAGNAAEPLRFEVNKLRLALQNAQWHGERALPAARVQLSARVGAAGATREPGAAVEWKGQLGTQPLLAGGALRIERFPVHLFEPYFAETLPLSLVRAEAGYTGNVVVRSLPAGLDVEAGGDVLLGDVHVNALAGGGELLSWQTLGLKGLKFTQQPGKRAQLEIGEAALNDFYSRLVITEQGRFNLQDVGAAPAPFSAASASAAPAAAASAPIAAASAAPASPPEPGLPLDIRIGATKLSNGKVDFSDRFVRPNYSAALTELNGSLGAFRSDSREMATLQLRGRAAGTALLEISGQLNPFAKPLALDIKARATDLELAPLSPYAGKYAGYAIERGKLSMEVAYKIDADGKLDAKNQVILNQLTFGEKIDSPDATKLPVLLAVALLKDRSGVIDINLPVSGSLNDPQFSIGGIIWKLILNLLTKALTAPFALLAGGGSEDLSLVEFRPGTALVNAGGRSAIDKVAKALIDKPALKMTVTGAADPVSEREAWLSATLEARLAIEARREALRSGAPAAAAGASAAASAAAPLGSEERARVLRQLYKDTEIPNKPRNAIGFVKDIPGPEMEALLKSRISASSEAMRELALQRGITVRDALIAKGLPSERLFLAAPKLRAAGETDAAWTPRVQLSLSER